MSSIYFKEEQQFPLWLRLLTLVTSLGLIGALLFSNEVDSWFEIAIPMVIMALVTALIFSFRIHTKIIDDVIEVQSKPLMGMKRYKMSELSDLKMYNTYKWNRFPGGWGYRVDWKGNVYHNAAGFRGILLEQKNGKRVFIGSQKLEELERIINYWEEKYGSA